jgi:hypothetical protein
MKATTTTTNAADIAEQALTLRQTLTAYAGLTDPLTVMEGRHILQMVADLAALVSRNEERRR